MDLEARAHAEHPEALRLWLRMLTCTQLVEKQVRSRLRERFDTTLPRFDLMAQLERAPDGLRMNELSRRMMVTGGNVTGITDQLVTEGLVERVDVQGDRRAYRVRLTASGRRQFRDMAAQHEAWIVQAFAGLTGRDVTTLHRLLGKVKAQHQPNHSAAAPAASTNPPKQRKPSLHEALHGRRQPDAGAVFRPRQPCRTSLCLAFRRTVWAPSRSIAPSARTR